MSIDQLRQIAPDLYVSPQLQPEDMAALAAKGVRTVINNRPDNEEPGQPKADVMRTAAEAAGLKYEFLPVVGNMITEADVIAFDHHLRELPAPIVAFCRSGNRCSILFNYVQGLRNRG